MTNPLGDLISRGEGGYNSYNRGTLHGRIVPANQNIDFARMTLDELTRRQALSISSPDKVFAVGKYQLIPPTMAEAVSRLHLDGNLKYEPEIQERIFSDYLIRTKRPAIYRYIVDAPGASLHGAQKAACQEWASIDDPDTPGKPFGDYAKHGNHSSIRAEQVGEALIRMQFAYKANIAKGMTPDDAWRSVTGQISEKRTQGEPITKPPAAPPRESNLRGHDVVEMRTLQESFRELGYRDANGHLLVIDGDLGPNTLHAIKSFQRAHHLHVDGIVGKHTLAALEDAKRWPLLSEATHPQHRLYAQVEEGIRKLPGHGRRDAREIDNAAVALTIAAHTSGLRQVDHVVLGSNGVNLFAVQGRMEDPGHRRVHVELAHAVAHAVDHRSMAMSHPAPEHLHAVALAQQQATPRAPSMAGP